MAALVVWGILEFLACERNWVLPKNLMLCLAARMYRQVTLSSTTE